MTDRPMLIVKTGSAPSPINSVHGDFDGWICDGLAADPARVLVRDVTRSEVLPPAESVSAVVVTGSPAMLSEGPPWLDETARWLAESVGSGLPTLGICFGHQLLAHSLGGVVGRNPAGREIGTVTVNLLQPNDDPLLGVFGHHIVVQATHVESVLRLPGSAVHLASSALDPHHAFRVGDTAWGVQFHPEFGAEIMQAYLHERRDILLAEGFDVDLMIDQVHESPHGRELLQRFAGLVKQRT